VRHRTSWQPCFAANGGATFDYQTTFNLTGLNPATAAISGQWSTGDQGLNILIPLPSALPLFATGLGALGLLQWRRKRKALAALRRKEGLPGPPQA
jgi:hypothetical protein